MLFLLLKFLYIFILSYVYGYVIVRERASFPLTALTGLFGISVIGAILSFWLPLAGKAQLLLLLGGVSCFFLRRQGILSAMSYYREQVREASLVTKGAFVIAVVYVIFLSSLQSLTYDEGLYYAQFIKWVSHYKVVPGLANLHIRFGFNSHWHIVAALFDTSWLTGITDNHINGALYLLVMLYLLPDKQDNRFISLLKVGLLVMINLPQTCVYNIIAPAADLPVYYIGILLIVCWLQGERGMFFLLAPLFLITVKLSAIPVLLLTGFYCLTLLRKREFGQLFGICGMAVVVIAPWIARNIILTGYPLFPLELPDLFHTGWAVPRERIHATLLDIKAFAFYRTADVPRLMADSLSQRITFWFLHALRGPDKALLLLAFVSPFVVYFRRRTLPEGFYLLYTFLLAGTAFWLLQAPDPRFGYSYLAPLFIITMILAFPWIRSQYGLVVVLLFQFGTLFLYKRIYQTFTTAALVHPVAHSTWWLSPTPYPEQSVVIHGTPFVVRIPDTTELCWDNPLPCADHMPKGVVMRGNTLEDGFRVE